MANQHYNLNFDLVLWTQACVVADQQLRNEVPETELNFPSVTIPVRFDLYRCDARAPLK